MAALWRTFITYYCQACDEDITRKAWAEGQCPHCGATWEEKE
jgi:predicted RNA-binding Zn-ribbon protein involved in translation (DUF1610 family)